MILRCAEALTAGRQRAAPVVDLDEKFKVQFFLAMTLRVPLDEMLLVPQLAQLCAVAMDLSRRGNFDSARSILERAGRIHARPDLTRDTRVALQGFHYPAEAYLHYKMGDDDRAEALLRAALRRCDELAEAGDYPMEGRRMHLIRNIVRARVAAGRGADACSLACQTMRYLQGEMACRPYPKLQGSTMPAPVEAPDRLVFLDQMLHEVSRVLAASDEAAPQIDPPLLSASGREAEEPRVRHRLGALEAGAGHDLTGYLEHVAAFFEEGPAYMPRAWEATASEFMAVCRTHAPDVAARLAEAEALA